MNNFIKCESIIPEAKAFWRQRKTENRDSQLFQNTQDMIYTCVMEMR